MKNKLFLSIIAILIVGLSCTAQQKNGVFNNVTPQEFKQQIKAEKGILLDIRTPQETAQGKIEGATEINFYSDNFIEQVSKYPKDQPIYIYCASGRRSAEASKQLSAQGFTKVYNLLGGFGAWSQSGLQLDK